MRNFGNTKNLCQIIPNNHLIQEFYDPLTPSQLVKKKPIPVKNASCFRTLFDDNQDEQNKLQTKEKKQNKQNQRNDDENNQISENKFLNKFFANIKNPKKVASVLKQQKSQYQPFSFNKKIKVKYPQTPHFKNQLLSPFWKFNKDNKYNLDTLQKNINKGGKNEYISIQMNSDPLQYVTESAKYFIGIALKLKQKGQINQCMMLLKLACYTQPYNQKAWRKYIEFVQQRGQIRKCFNLAKTAFLFCSIQQFAKIYISHGQKCGVPIQQLKGIITNVSNPDLFEKVILAEIGKLCIKYKQVWKGLKIIFQICIWNQFKLPVCTLIQFLAKILDNLGYTDKALAILKKSFGKNMSKLQIYTLYLEIKNRQSKGQINQTVIKQVLEYTDNISGENRYKFYLQIAQIYFKQNNQTYKHYLQQAYFAAKNLCAAGTGYNKAIRHIFFSVLRWKKIFYPFNVANDLSIFEQNRQRFIIGEPLIQYEFTQWKYYLLYGLQKRDDLLLEASKKFPLTGRLIAEWIHCLRLKLPILDVLKMWRQKIKQVPKSGQLWCEGGRIYSELKDFQNASKCFRYAIHFTPQYGDSFFQELKILLLKGKFRQIQKLRNLMFVSQPFYGHVWSYIRASEQNFKLSLSDIWNIGLQSIKSNLYRMNTRTLKGSKPYLCEQLTVADCYNYAYKNPNSQQIRVRLFSSYEQIQSRN